MKLKVYSLILICFFLVVLIQSLTSLIGQAITDKAEADIYDQVVKKYPETKSVPLEKMGPQIIESVSAIRERTFAKYQWILLTNGAFQIILMLLLALGCSHLVIRIVSTPQNSSAL